MSKRLLSVFILFGVSAGIGCAQSSGNPTNTGSTKPPEVFLDNHRPLINKKKDKAPTSRDLTGKVIDSSGQGIEGALVTLTNTKTNAKTTFITKRDGRFNFDDLSLTIDYQLQARFKEATTEPRNISQYDPNTRIVRILQMGSASEDAKTTAPSKQ